MKTIRPRNAHSSLIFITLFFTLSGCTSGTFLSTRPLTDRETVHGAYNLIMYSGQNAQDLRSIAILDRADDSYTIVPYGAAFTYRVLNNLPAPEAMETGVRFLNDLYSFRATDSQIIYAPDQTIIGYELTPLFMPIYTGLLGDILDTSYFLQAENKVVVYVDFKTAYQSPQNAHNSSFLWGH